MTPIIGLHFNYETHIAFKRYIKSKAAEEVEDKLFNEIDSNKKAALNKREQQVEKHKSLYTKTVKVVLNQLVACFILVAFSFLVKIIKDNNKESEEYLPTLADIQITNFNKQLVDGNEALAKLANSSDDNKAIAAYSKSASRHYLRAAKQLVNLQNWVQTAKGLEKIGEKYKNLALYNVEDDVDEDVDEEVDVEESTNT